MPVPARAGQQSGRIGIGLSRAGLRGALAAWAGFTLPSAIVMALVAFGVAVWGGGVFGAGPLHGLKLAAVAVVAQAVWGMGRTLSPDAARATVAVAAACAVLAWPGAATQVAVIIVAGVVGLMVFRPPTQAAADLDALAIPVGRRVGALLLSVFALLLVGLPVIAALSQSMPLAIFDVFYRAGALVFGGGHVVLPLLQAEVVPRGWVGEEAFLAGYGAAQALPGPLSTFAAFLGAIAGSWVGAGLALVAIFLPSFLLVIGALPFWERLRRQPSARAALTGVNAAVVGVLLAALYDPVWTAAVRGPGDFAQVLVAYLALVAWRIPPWAVVVGSALAGWLRVLAASG